MRDGAAAVIKTYLGVPGPPGGAGPVAPTHPAPGAAPESGRGRVPRGWQPGLVCREPGPGSLLSPEAGRLLLPPSHHGTGPLQ